MTVAASTVPSDSAPASSVTNSAYFVSVSTGNTVLSVELEALALTLNFGLDTVLSSSIIFTSSFTTLESCVLLTVDSTSLAEDKLGLYIVNPKTNAEHNVIILSFM
ncbi:hypothetical protein [Peribacillus sp. NPDC096448]|uniref:hypothetical protein n=1 Tax=Peribacillus sp. NPDC096448 TaxID=3364395 RepID=UPI0038089B2E